MMRIISCTAKPPVVAAIAGYQLQRDHFSVVSSIARFSICEPSEESQYPACILIPTTFTRNSAAARTPVEYPIPFNIEISQPPKPGRKQLSWSHDVRIHPVSATAWNQRRCIDWERGIATTVQTMSHILVAQHLPAFVSYANLVRDKLPRGVVLLMHHKPSAVLPLGRKLSAVYCQYHAHLSPTLYLNLRVNHYSAVHVCTNARKTIAKKTAQVIHDYSTRRHPQRGAGILTAAVRPLFPMGSFHSHSVSIIYNWVHHPMY
jgi:hypothetical protein